MNIEGTRLAGKVGYLGDALFHLSDKLRGSGFLSDDANAAEYEKVMSAFQALEDQVCET